MTASEGLAAPRLLARNTVWNLVGQVAPMVAAVVSIPILIRHVGVDGFGVLSLAWILVGYFSLFDLGLGRALTRFVADKLGGHDAGGDPAHRVDQLPLMADWGSWGRWRRPPWLPGRCPTASRFRAR